MNEINENKTNINFAKTPEIDMKEMVVNLGKALEFYEITKPDTIKAYENFVANPNEENLQNMAKSVDLDCYLKVAYKLFKEIETPETLKIYEDWILKLKCTGMCSRETYLLLDEISMYRYLELVSSKKTINMSEKEYVDKLVDNFDEIFPKYRFITTEKIIKNIGRIDIFAEEIETNRAVIIECKKGKQNPTKQLLAYGSGFKNPILIGITEHPIKGKLNRIIYKTYNELFCNNG